MQSMTDKERKASSRIQKTGIFLLLLQIVMFIGDFNLTQRYMEQLLPAFGALLTMSCVCIFLSILIQVSLLRGKRFDRVTVLLMMMLVVNSCYLLSDGSFWVIDGNRELMTWNMIDNAVYCICPVFMTLIFWYLLDEWTGTTGPFRRLANYAIHIISLAYILFTLGTFIGKYYFYVSEETGFYVRGSLYPVPYVMMTAILMICFLRILMSHLGFFEKLILASYALVPYFDTLARYHKPGPSFLSIATFISVFFLYTNIFVRREREMADRDLALAVNQLQILQMQINPHFFFNTLTSVAFLCDTEPQKAQEMVYRLSEYLQDNFTTINKPSLIPFSEELTHLRHYMSIESMRFPDIVVHYEIATDRFRIPNQTLQPLVENAIRHGIRKRMESKGNIRISSEETEDAFVVRVEDDGVGFSPGEEMKEGKHIGIANVRSRLSLLCRGTLSLSSVPGEKTVCEILLPKEGQNEFDL